MKKMMFKGLLLALLITGGIVTTTKLYSQSEGTGSWNPVSIAIGYVDQYGVFHQTGSMICCGSGVTGCTPENC
jgi:hypothetical protein